MDHGRAIPDTFGPNCGISNFLLGGKGPEWKLQCGGRGLKEDLLQESGAIRFGKENHTRDG